MVGPRPLDTEGVLGGSIPDEGTLGEPPTPTTVHVQDTIITAWTIRHPTRNRNDPIARAELYQLSYIPPSQVEHA
ncbi:hypothetical protein N665_3655s0006 [Sinapis alba]|nr:hypothetical protein N665_3655s0006 [Sinapis alba]